MHTDRALHHAAVDALAAPGEANPSRRRLAVAVAMTVLVLGLAGAGVAATIVSGADSVRSQRALSSTANQIASILGLAIQHEQDLVVGVGAYVAGNPTSSNAQFRHWVDSVRAFQRYPELQRLGLSVVVPAAGLASFASRAAVDPVGPLGPGGRFPVRPAGRRPYYCFAALLATRSAQMIMPAGVDYCAGNPELSSRDTGRGAYRPTAFWGHAVLAVETPAYRGSVVPTTIAARRKAFLGWVGTILDPRVLLGVSLRGHPGTAVSFRYRAAESDVTFRAGTVPSRRRATTIDLNNGWTVTAYGRGAPVGILHSRSAQLLLLVGIAVNALLAALLYVLATGRDRALLMVRLKTGELRHQALHDVLTGLPNRALINDRLDQLLLRARREGSAGAVLFVDIDGFKDVNDSFGHSAGDHLLEAVALRIAATLREADTVGRMGGDEFVVLLDGPSSGGAPEIVADRLLTVMRQPFEVPESPTPLVVTASIGIATGDRDTPDQLLCDADVALYEAKAAGRDCYQVFQAGMRTGPQQRYEFGLELRAALEDEQFRLVYQPIFDLDDLSMVGVEALIRWQHPTRGLILPDQFIPLLESNGQIIDVGAWMLRQACDQVAAWRAQGNDLTVSVNVSGRQLDRDVIVEHVRNALAMSRVVPAALTIEVTETALMSDVETSARRLKELKALGVKVAIDDFGTGYSSLAYLQRLPADCLKIDRTFIDAITRSAEGDALVHTLVQLGRNLGLTTLAEGVESSTQLDHLRMAGVDQVQGYLLGRPLDPAALATLLRERDRANENSVSASS